MRRFIPWCAVVAVFVLDRASKLAIMDRLRPGEMMVVLPWLSLSHVHNRGIAFSLFAEGGGLSRLLLHLVIACAVVLIAWMLVRDGKRTPLLGVGLGMILGGALGNLLDRILYDWVVDFIHVWVMVDDRVHSWPDFNVADSAISVGAVLLVLHELLAWRRHRLEARSIPAPESLPEAADAPSPD